MESENAASEHIVVFQELPRKKMRIETQIHRRRAAKVFSPMTLEWEQAKPVASEQHTDQEQV